MLAADPRLTFSISFTTRAPRPGEVPGKDYFFISTEEFQRLRHEGALVEWVEQFGYYYGTSRQWVEETLGSGSNVVFDIEVRGAENLKRTLPRAVLIFIVPPSLEELERRLTSRGHLDPAELSRRLQQGRSELTAVDRYDFVVVNDELDKALIQLQAIVTACRCRTSHLWPQLEPRFLT